MRQAVSALPGETTCHVFSLCVAQIQIITARGEQEVEIVHCISVDFKAVHGCRLDLSSEMPWCGQDINGSRGHLEMVIWLSAKPDLLLLAIPTCPKMLIGIPWPRRDVFPLARQEASPFAAWGAEELILWWVFWEVCCSASAQGVLSREMRRQWCLHGITPIPVRGISYPEDTQLPTQGLTKNSEILAKSSLQTQGFAHCPSELRVRPLEWWEHDICS